MFEFIRMMRKFTMILSIFLLFGGVASAQQQGSGGAKKIDTAVFLAVWASAGAAIMSAAKLIKSVPFPFTGRIIDLLC
jgi:hypothetical protein